MQAGHKSGDYVTRARAKLADWNAMWSDAQRDDRFSKCAASELIRIAETGKDPDGRKLTSGDLYALHGAWQSMFGEGLGVRCAESGVPDGEPEPLAGEHPLLALPDDQMLRPRDVVRMCGIPRTTLKRWRREGHFPKPQRISPAGLPLHVGWPARQVKAWLKSVA